MKSAIEKILERGLEIDVENRGVSGNKTIRLRLRKDKVTAEMCARTEKELKRFAEEHGKGLETLITIFLGAIESYCAVAKKSSDSPI